MYKTYDWSRFLLFKAGCIINKVIWLSLHWAIRVVTRQYLWQTCPFIHDCVQHISYLHFIIWDIHCLHSVLISTFHINTWLPISISQCNALKQRGWSKWPRQGYPRRGRGYRHSGWRGSHPFLGRCQSAKWLRHCGCYTKVLVNRSLHCSDEKRKLAY